MRRSILGLVTLLAGVCVAPTKASAWSEATHAYIADHTGKTSGFRNYNEIYGAMAPDTFNMSYALRADLPTLLCVRSYTHGALPSDTGFLEFWEQASWWGLDRNAAFAYAFTHNDVFGADYRAHWVDIHEDAPGYVVAKAMALVEQIDATKDEAGLSVWDYLGLEPDYTRPLDDPANLIVHFMLERAGDLVIKREDPNIGMKMFLASLVRTERFPDLMVDVMAGCSPLLTEDLIRASERQFRVQTMTYGLTLLLDEQEALAAVARQLSDSAPEFLAGFGGTYDPALQPLIDQFVLGTLKLSLAAVEDDYMDQIDFIVDEVAANAPGSY